MSAINHRQGRTPSLPFYYGWLVLAGSALSEMAAIGATSYSAGLYVLPLQAEFHLSRAAASSPVSILFSGAMVFAPFAGRILDAWPIRRAMVLGAVLLCGAMVTIAFSSRLWLMVLALLLPAAFGFILLGPVTTATLVSRWFHRRRGLALGFAAVATSGGGFTVVPLMSRAIEHYGWRSALLQEAAVFAVLSLVLALFVLKDRPADLGLDGGREMRGADAPQPPAAGGFLSRWREILGRRDFWAPCLVVATVSGLSQGIVVSAVPYGVQLGLGASQAAFLVAVFSLTAAVTKVSAGLLADLIDKRWLLILATLSMCAALGLLSSWPAIASLAAACALAGLALGAALPSSAALVAVRFGAARFGATMGWIYTFIGGLTIAAAWLAGAMFDLTGGYRNAFELFLAFCVAVPGAALALEWRRAR